MSTSINDQAWQVKGALVFQPDHSGEEPLWSAYVQGRRIQFEEACVVAQKLSAAEEMYQALQIARVQVLKRLRASRHVVQAAVDASRPAIEVLEQQKDVEEVTATLTKIDEALAKAQKQ